MVHPFLVRLVTQAVTTVTKSALKAYQRVIKEQATGQKAKPVDNPMNDWIKKTMQANNLADSPMTKDEALKILNIEPKEDQPLEELQQQILMKYVKLYSKNEKVGAQYIMSKVYNAKELLMEDAKDIEQEFYKTNKIDPETLIQQNEQEEQKK